MSDPNTSPVSLAGSFDYDDLKTGLEKAAKGAAKNYDTAVAAALDKASATIAKEQDARDIPGYRFVDVENKDLGVVEKVQVYDAKLAAKANDEGTDAISEAELLNQQAEVNAQAVDKASTSTKE